MCSRWFIPVQSFMYAILPINYIRIGSIIDSHSFHGTHDQKHTLGRSVSHKVEKLPKNIVIFFNILRGRWGFKSESDLGIINTIRFSTTQFEPTSCSSK